MEKDTNNIQHQSMQYDLYRLVVIAIFMGAFVAVIGVSVSVWYEYEHLGNAVFNRRSDFLGDYVHAEFAFVFNIALMLTGICIMLAMFGLYRLEQGFFSHYLSLVGSWVGVSVLLMGVFPINYLEMHRFVSTSFLIGTVCMYVLCILDRFSGFPTCKGVTFGLSVVGFIAALSLLLQLDWRYLDFEPCDHLDNEICWIAMTMWLQTQVVLLWCLSFAWTIKKSRLKIISRCLSVI